MSEKTGENKTLREYLLGNIEPSEREDLEERFMVDDALFREIMREEEDLIQDYADDDLTSDERRAFESHFLVTRERREKLKFAKALRKYVDQQPPSATLKSEGGFFDALKRSFRSPLFAGSLALVIIGLFAGWYFILRNTVNHRATVAINREYSSARPFEPRITGLDYLPVNTTRGADDKKESLEAKNTEYELSGEVISHPGIDSFRAYGRWSLARKNFDEAIKYLEKARDISPTNEQVRSDLGTAYLEKSGKFTDEQGGDKLKMRGQALEEFEKALEINPKLFEALFNKAICLELMELYFQTTDAWNEYLKLDPTSGWAEEARQHLTDLEKKKPQSKSGDQLLQEFIDAYRARDDEKAYQIVSRNREMITGKLVPQRLVKSFLETGEPAAKAEYLSALKYIGKLEQERSKDPFWTEMADYYFSVSRAKLPALRQAQEAVFKGYELSGSGNHKGALTEFQNAEKLFQTNGDKWNAGICGYWIGYTLNRQDSLPESTAELENLLEPYKNYGWLTSQFLNWLIVNMLAAKKFSKAIDYLTRTFERLEITADPYLSQKTLQLGADLYRILGRLDRSLDLAQRNLLLGAAVEASQRQKWRDLNTVSSLFFSLKLYSASIACQSEAMNIALGPFGDKTFVIQSNVRLGLMYAALENYERAKTFVNDGLDVAENLTDSGLRTNNVAYARLNKGHILRESGDCAAALEEYNSSLTFYNEKMPVNKYDALKGRLRCYLASHDTPSLEAELPVTLKLFGDYRSEILEEQNRNAFFDNGQDIYDLAVGYESGNQNHEAAFNYSEESRARSLLDMQNSPIEVVKDGANVPEVKFSAVTVPLKLPEIQRDLPSNVQIIEYAVLDDRTLIWLITRDKFLAFTSPISKKNLSKKVSAYLGMVGDHSMPDRDKLKTAGRELYETLLTPVTGHLSADKETCIIPDKILFRLPFSTLISPDSQKYFLSEQILASAPSLNVFLNATKKSETLAGLPAENVLSIGNPAFNEKEFPTLKNLESAKPEAESIARLYHSGSPLTRKDATKDRVKAALPKANVIHFAGHYLVDENSPLLSGFVLSENPITRERKDSILANYEIFRDNLSNTRLIVLAACESGVETYYEGEGMIGAARTFLARGVPLVIASQWAVDSKPTTEIMVRFHKYRKEEHLSTARALRRAQLDMLEGDSNLYRDPYYWAGFTTFGGYAQF